MKKIIVTGGSGFIGSNLLNFLIKKITTSLISTNLPILQTNTIKKNYLKININFLKLI